jgi:hypothetical protein
MCIVTGIFLVPFGLALLLSGDAPIAFTAFVFLAFGWNVYWWLFRIAAVLRLDEDALHWEAPLRSGEIPLASLTGVRPMRWSALSVIKHTTGRSVLFLPVQGLDLFLEGLSVARPDLPVRDRRAVRRVG